MDSFNTIASWQGYQMDSFSTIANWQGYQMDSFNTIASWQGYQMDSFNTIASWQGYQMDSFNTIANWQGYQIDFLGGFDIGISDFPLFLYWRKFILRIKHLRLFFKMLYRYGIEKNSESLGENKTFAYSRVSCNTKTPHYF